MDNNIATKCRIPAIDALKTIAIIGVLIIHTCSYGYSCGIGTFDWCSVVFWSCLARASVPIFLMCSGAVLLDPEKELSIRTLFSKHLLRIVIAMLIWAMAYKVYWLCDSGEFTVQFLILSLKEVFLFKQEFHLYYLHIMILVYIFLPITRVLTAHKTKRELQYFLAVWFVLGIVYPTAINFWPFTLLSGIPLQWLINMTYASIGYSVLGFYFQKYAARKPKLYIAVFAIGFSCVFGGTLAMSISQGSLYELFLGGMSPGVSLMAIGLFGFVTFSMKQGASGDNFIFKISKASFCIYLIHLFFLYIFNPVGLTVSILPYFILIPVVAIANLACSYLVYILLSYIPIVKKYLV